MCSRVCFILHYSIIIIVLHFVRCLDRVCMVFEGL